MTSLIPFSASSYNAEIFWCKIWLPIFTQVSRFDYVKDNINKIIDQKFQAPCAQVI